MKQGDIIDITRADGLQFTYRVTRVRVATAHASGIDRHAKGFKLVLSTCYPFEGITQGQERYLVEAVLQP